MIPIRDGRGRELSRSTNVPTAASARNDNSDAGVSFRDGSMSRKETSA